MTGRNAARAAGAAAGVLLVVLAGLAASAGAAPPGFSPDHFVPVEKKLDAAQVRGLYARGEPTVWRGDALRHIGMPVGGIAAGQVYLGGDGRLLHWDVYNRHVNTGYGRTNYRPRRPAAPLAQGFAIRVAGAGGAVLRRLDGEGIRDIRFRGEYPVGQVEYRDPALGVEVTLEAFSPFIPLNAADSALPATVLHFTLKNTRDRPVRATLAGWLENGVLLHNRALAAGARVNSVVHGERLQWVRLAARTPPQPKATRPPVLFEDFEGDDYGRWKAVGEAFGTGPARGTLPGQQRVSGYHGRGLVNTYLGKDGPHGVLTSPEFTITRPFINFLIGGGDHAGKTCMNLRVGGKVVRTATGRRDERLVPCAWSVRDLLGRKAVLEIVDRASGAWGHINIDRIEFADVPRRGPGRVEDLEDFGTMGLGVLGPREGAMASAAAGCGTLPGSLFAPDGTLAERGPGDAGPLAGAVGRVMDLAAGATATADFIVAWHFPNHPSGRRYAGRFRDALAVGRYVAEDLDRLAGQTRLWRRTYYDESTLPHWLLERLAMPVSTLATNTVQWWGSGRFWGWEGVGCCTGTCTHVWNYEQALARLFPSLERSIRTMQDFGAGFDAATGLVGFRSNRAYAADGQCGTILKAWREHLLSPDGRFLEATWPKIRKAVTYLLARDAADGAEDGMLTDSQHNTFDINFHGPNTFVGSLYLAALRAAEEMAKLRGEQAFAARCRRAFAAGRQRTLRELYNGEYFIQKVDLEKYPRHQYADGCLADQLFGQNWAHQLDLGYLYPPEAVRSAMAAVFKYNWAPDVGPQNRAHRPERVFADPGEAGLFLCTWPRSKHLDAGVRYRNEVWTGIEYQVAAGLAYEGLLDEAMVVVRAVHDRYDAAKRNPFNEVECGDHYARAMASWGVLLALSGWVCDGPAGRFGFAPRITPENFRCAFTAPEGWGTISQQRGRDVQRSTFAVRWGRLRIATVEPAAAPWKGPSAVTVRLGDRAIDHRTDAGPAGRPSIRLARPVVVPAGEALLVELRPAPR